MPPRGLGGGAEAATAPGPATARMARLKRGLTALAGWRRWLAAAALGAAAAAALPPVYALPLLVPAFVGLTWLVEEAPGWRRAFVDGWWFGFGLSLAGLYWIFNSFIVDAPRYGWMAPFAVAGVSAVMALYPAATAALSRLAFSRREIGGAGRVLVLAAFWTAMEWARGWLLTGFSWNLIGSVWTVSDTMIQLAAVAGVYGLSLLTVAAAAMPAVLADGAADIRNRLPVIAAAVALVVVWGSGAARLATAGDQTVAGVRLRLVQPNIPQDLKWRPELRAGHVNRQLQMSKAPPAAGPLPTHVIWAETAVPYVLADNPSLVSALAAAAPPGGVIIVGAPRTTAAGVAPRRIWNSLFAIDGGGRIAAIYDKVHLVPFGEYVPLRGILDIDKLTGGRFDFSPGPGRRTLQLAGLPPVSPLICYEVIFPGRVADAARRPGWLLNLTNDAWFGRSSGPYQHFAAARLRAVEEGLPLVRVANTGISGVVDAYGRIRKSLGLGRAGVVDGALPVALAPTPYARFGDAIAAVILVVAFTGGFLIPPIRRR